MMEYKGYFAWVEFDDSVDVLHGRVVNGGPYPIATFETTETRALRREFERSVDEYLAVVRGGWRGAADAAVRRERAPPRR